MAKRPKSGPAKTYKYGCSAPVTGYAEIEEQRKLAHKYRNKLCEIERLRRERTESVLRRISPDLFDIEERIQALEVSVDSVYDKIKSRRVTERKKVGANKEEATELRGLKSGLKKLRAERKEMRAKLFSDNGSAELKQVDTDAHDQYLAARGECGVYWGTYQLVEDACKSFRKGSPPRFVRRDPGGAVSVQVMGGMTMQDAFACKSTLFRIEQIPDDAWTNESRSYRRHACKTRAWIRFASDEKSNPIWAVVPVTIHRGIPEGGRIKRVTLMEKRVGTHSEWSLNLSVEFKSGLPATGDLASEGIVGVDAGWRKYADGSMRVAYWAGSDGRHGEVLLDADTISRFEKVNAIRSTRDMHFNTIIGELRSWKKSHEIPEWLAERLKHCHLWKAQVKLASVVSMWRNARFTGDDQMYDLLEIWRKKDKHLYDWESHQRLSVLRRRTEIYRVLAANLRRSYSKIKIEKLDLTKFQEHKEVDKSDDTNKRVRSNRVVASPSDLFDAIKKCGAEFGVVDPRMTSKTCSVCGHENMELGSQDIWVCSHCYAKWDRDHNAAINIMNGSEIKDGKARGGVEAEEEGSLADVAA